MKRSIYRELKRILKEGQDVYIITITKAKEEKLIGNKILKNDKELIFEDSINKEIYINIAESIEFNEGGKNITVNDDIEVFIEHVGAKPSLVICGAGHIALPLCNLAKMLDFTVTIIDEREEFANRDRLTEADNIICLDFESALEKVDFNNNSYFVIVTRGHKYDKNCLEIILKNNFKYVGMIGSKAKVVTVVKDLIKGGFTEEIIKKIHTPIGIKIGAQTPAEIAVSIAAEIISVKNESNIYYIDEEILNKINEKDEAKVLVTIMDKKGSSPRGAGAKMLVFRDESFIGTIGGGIVENAAIKKAIEAIEKEKSFVETYDLSNSKAAKLGMACGGTIKVLFEYIK